MEMCYLICYIIFCYTYIAYELVIRNYDVTIMESTFKVMQHKLLIKVRVQLLVIALLNENNGQEVT